MRVLPLLVSVTVLLALRAQEPAPAPPAYDPLAVPKEASTPSLLLSLRDGTRTRDLPLRIFLPDRKQPAPVILFSHGLGGTRDSCGYLGQHWSRRGYAVVFVQHPGSDDSVWKDLPLRDRMPAMEKAASGVNSKLRCEDVHVVLDHLAVWNTQEGHECKGRLDLEHVGMSGHSFGAVTTQNVSGQSVPVLGQRFLDPRIDAALALSPSSPRAGSAERAFASVSVPWCLMTGTEDTSPIGGQDVASRLAVFQALPATIDRYELVLHGAEHSAFSERALPGDRGSRNPNHHRAILALSTAFWDAHLCGNAAARAWLHGEQARSVLEEKDRWQVGERKAPAK